MITHPCTECTDQWKVERNVSCVTVCEKLQKWGSQPVVYLAGAMDRVDPEFALGWRRDARALLENHNFLVLDPTEGKDLYAHKIDKKRYTKDTAYNTIVGPDLAHIKKADIILAEMSRTDCPYHGTSMELVYGHLWDKHVYVWGDCKSSWVIYHATKPFIYMEDAIHYMITHH